MKLPYEYKGVLLLVLLVLVLPGTAWRFAMRDTYTAWRDCKRVAEHLATITPASVSEESTTTVATRPELILSGRLLDSIRHAMVPGVLIAGYEPLVTASEAGASVHTAKLILTGGYADLLRIVDELERTLPQCRLRSMEWSVQTDRRTRCMQISLTLYIQQIVFNQ